MSTIFGLHGVFPKTIIHYNCITWSISKKVFTIFGLHEVFPKQISNKFGLHEVFPKIISNKFGLYEVFPKIINNYICITGSISKKNTTFGLHEVFPKNIIHYILIAWSISKKIIHHTSFNAPGQGNWFVEAMECNNLFVETADTW